MDTTLTSLIERRTRARGDCRRPPGEPPWAAVFDALPTAALVLEADGRLLARNPAAAALLGPLAEPGARCCELLGCRLPGGGLAGGCVTRLALDDGGGGFAGEWRVQLEGGEPAWLAAAPLAPGGEIVVTLRGAGADGGVGVPPPGGLRLRLLGPTRVEVDGRPLAGDWLGHRSGLVLKYLAAQRGRVIPREELLEVFWPGGGRAGASNVRQAVHTLRDRLEPGRPRGVTSAFVLARQGGYELSERVRVDADDFEATAHAGLQALARGGSPHAAAALAEAAAAYGGDFLADEPYAEWALAERERLRGLAAQVLRGLAGIAAAAGDDEGAAAPLQRLADLEPLDLEAQRELIALLLRRGRHPEALRRYELVRRRYTRAFGVAPAFRLADLAARA